MPVKSNMGAIGGSVSRRDNYTTAEIDISLRQKRFAATKKPGWFKLDYGWIRCDLYNDIKDTEAKIGLLKPHEVSAKHFLVSKLKSLTELATRELQSCLEESANSRDLFWYDTKTKHLLHFRGTNLEFQYDPYQQKQIPSAVVITAQTNRFIDNAKEIFAWIEEYKDELQLDIVDHDEKSITIGFPLYADDEDHADIVEQAMYAARFRYDVNYRQINHGGLRSKRLTTSQSLG